ncbi:MAG: AAA family ATPase, partial [Clostridia bacterium]|nr:AAA family ATPase [Clostridia bacterium]
SNTASSAIGQAMSDVSHGKVYSPPPHLQDAHYSGASKLGRGLTYQYPHNFPNNYITQQYLPDELKSVSYYEYGNNKTEQAAKAYWDKIKK